MSLGLAITLFYLFKFFEALGKEVPVLDMLILLALSQWVVGPAIDYLTEATHFKYFMYVDRDQYFSIVVPAVICFITPVLLLQKKVDIRKLDSTLKSIVDGNPKLPWIILVVGFLSGILSSVAPSALSFFLFLTAQFKYIALLYLFFSSKSYGTPFLILIFGLTVISSIRLGLFHDLILWLGLFLSFVVHRYGWKPRKTIFVLAIGVLFAIVTQSIKSQYREIIAEKPELASVQTFSSLAYEQIVMGKMFNSQESVNDLNVRLNQGWIISAIFYNIPNFTDFVGGETIQDAISASLLPRFLNPNKKKAGGQENFRRFTGLMIRGDTSMGSSILGEAYANYGAIGTMIFMFLWGLFLILFYNLVAKLTLAHPSLILWLPLIFLQALKAETELVVVLNHLIKSSIVIFLFFWIATKTLRWRL